MEGGGDMGEEDFRGGGRNYFGMVCLGGGENKKVLGRGGGSYISSGIWGCQMCSIGFCFH